ncbi:Protein tssc1, partial [Coemansia thaxteri]
MEARQRTSHVYGIDRHSVSLGALSSTTSTHSRFALGTLGIKEAGEIHIVNFDSDEGQLHSTIHTHTAGIRALTAVPWDSNQLLVATTEGSDGVELLQVPTSTGSAAHVVGRLAMAGDTGTVLAAWPMSSTRQAAVGGGGAGGAHGVSVWDMGIMERTHSLAADELGAIAAHPQAASQLATADGSSIRTWDLRAPPGGGNGSGSQASVEFAHSGRVRALHYNPNMAHFLASGGDDACVRIWDARRPAGPLAEMQNHTHWVHAVQFNAHHDQLLLSAGSDALVNLESAVSLSSAHA